MSSSPFPIGEVSTPMLLENMGFASDDVESLEDRHFEVDWGTLRRRMSQASVPAPSSSDEPPAFDVLREPSGLGEEVQSFVSELLRTQSVSLSDFSTDLTEVNQQLETLCTIDLLPDVDDTSRHLDLEKLFDSTETSVAKEGLAGISFRDKAKGSIAADKNNLDMQHQTLLNFVIEGETLRVKLFRTGRLQISGCHSEAAAAAAADRVVALIKSAADCIGGAEIVKPDVASLKAGPVRVQSVSQGFDTHFSTNSLQLNLEALASELEAEKYQEHVVAVKGGASKSPLTVSLRRKGDVDHLGMTLGTSLIVLPNGQVSIVDATSTEDLKRIFDWFQGILVAQASSLTTLSADSDKRPANGRLEEGEADAKRSRQT